MRRQAEAGWALSHSTHRDGTGLRAKEARWSSHRRSSPWNRRSRVLQEEVLVTAYLPHEGDPFIVEFSQQPPSTAIDCIEGHMSETYPMAPRPEDHLPCKLHLALRHSRRCRDLYRIESRRIVEPTLRQIQARVDKRDRGLFRECGEDAHLAVLHLPQPPIPLPCDPRRGLALLRKRALVDEESRFHSADERVDLTARLADQSIEVPLGVREHVMQHLVIGLEHAFTHREHVGFRRGKQPQQIGLGRTRHRAGAHAKERRERFEMLRQPVEQTSDEGSNWYTIFTKSPSFTLRDKSTHDIILTHMIRRKYFGLTK